MPKKLGKVGIFPSEISPLSLRGTYMVHKSIIFLSTPTLQGLKKDTVLEK